MGSCKVALFLIFAFTAVASVAASTRCYACSSISGDEDCAKSQDPEYSSTMDCFEVADDAECIKLDIVRNGEPATVRSCILAGVTCDDVKKELDLIHIDLKNCTTCDDDLCNGE
nr:unnamed protein product [Callosobruchus chinensis]